MVMRMLNQVPTTGPMSDTALTGKAAMHQLHQLGPGAG